MENFNNWTEPEGVLQYIRLSEKMETIWLFAALIKVYKLVLGLHVCVNATLGEIKTMPQSRIVEIHGESTGHT